MIFRIARHGASPFAGSVPALEGTSGPRSGPTRIDTPRACYLIVSFRWLSSGACLTIVIV